MKTTSSFTIVDAENRQAWDDFITSHQEANFLQSWDFYEFYQDLGHDIVRRIIKDKKGKILAAYAGEVEPARRGRHLAIAGGPILDWDNKTLVKAVFEDIREQGIAKNCVFVRVRPQLERSEKAYQIFADNGLKPAPMYLSVEYAGILNLKDSEEDILKNASQGLRRKIRKAQKLEDLELTADASEASIKEFCRLEALHAERQGYVAFSQTFLEKQFQAFAKNGEVLIYTAKKDGETLAQNFIIFYGNEASYHYGVSSTLGTKYSAVPLLHLMAMDEARKRGITRYNFWGIVEKDETSHRFFGVSEFKRSFGVSELKYLPAHDLIIKPLPYAATKLFETARKKHRHV